MTVQLISRTHFFNRLTNLDPLLMIDLRSAEEYERNHLHGSYWINYQYQDEEQSDNLQDELIKVLTQRDFFGQVILIFVTSQSHSLDDPKTQSLLTQIQRIYQWSSSSSILSASSSLFEKIHSLFLLHSSYDQLYHQYSRCESFFQIFGQKLAPRSNVKSYPNEIISGRLYLGHERHATDVTVLNHLHVTHVLDATGVNSSEDVATTLGLAYLPLTHLWDSPDQDIAQFFSLTNEFIHTALTYPPEHGHYAVLVHCRAGISRSTTLVIAYLLYLVALHKTLPFSFSSPTPESTAVFSSLLSLCPLSSEKPFRDILSHLLLQRPVVYPNRGFCQQLLVYEASLFFPKLTDTEVDRETGTAEEGEIAKEKRRHGTLSYEHYEEVKSHIRSALHWKNDLSSSADHRDERALPALSASEGEPRNLFTDDEYLRGLGAYDQQGVARDEKEREGGGTNNSREKKPFLRRGEGRQKPKICKVKGDGVTRSSEDPHQS
jgi:hypothetical protein